MLSLLFEDLVPGSVLCGFRRTYFKAENLGEISCSFKTEYFVKIKFISTITLMAEKNAKIQ